MYGIPYTLLGARVAGDLGGVTCYTDRLGRKTVYPIAAPKEPASVEQKAQRSLFKAAHTQWKSLTSEEKANLEKATNQVSLCMTGQNLFMSACMTGGNTNLQAIARQTGLTLPTAPDLRS